MKKILFTLSLLLVVAVSYALSPKATYDVTPADFGMEYEEVKIPSTDSIMLNAWLFKPRKDGKSQKMIIISHSGDGNMEDMIEVAGQYVSLGYHVVTYDYRGYGTSTPFKISPKFFVYSQFAQDLEAVIDWSQKYDVKLTKDLHGFGIGAAISIGVGCNKKVINNIVADGPYLSLETVTKRLTETLLMPVGYDKTIMEPQFAFESKKGFHLDKILLICGDKDLIAKPEDMKALKKLNDKCTVYVFKGSENKQNFPAHKDEYFKQVKTFLGLK